ncbi:serine/threonine kinase [Aureococcus anophagefferens]|nr:serine/threonine kinase [Aureococcus anophagefferens]
MVLCGVLGAAAAAAAPRRVVWDGDAIVVAAAHGLALGALVERREAWCACLAKAVKAVARVLAVDGATPLSWAFDDRRWALIALEKLSAESAAALDAADKAAAAADRDAAAPVWTSAPRRRAPPPPAAAGSAALRGAWRRGWSSLCAVLGDQEPRRAARRAARAFWRSPLFAAAHLEGDDDDGKAAVLSCACAALRASLPPPLGRSLAGGPDDVADVPRETDGDGDEPNDERAPPKHRRHRLARWATRRRAPRARLCGNQIFNPTSMRAPGAAARALPGAVCVLVALLRAGPPPPLAVPAGDRVLEDDGCLGGDERSAEPGAWRYLAAAPAPALAAGGNPAFDDRDRAVLFDERLGDYGAARRERAGDDDDEPPAAAAPASQQSDSDDMMDDDSDDGMTHTPAPAAYDEAGTPRRRRCRRRRARRRGLRARRSRRPRGRARVPGREALLDGARQLLFASDDAAGGRLGAAAERDGGARRAARRGHAGLPRLGRRAGDGGRQGPQDGLRLPPHAALPTTTRARAAAADGAGALFESYGVASHAKVWAQLLKKLPPLESDEAAADAAYADGDDAAAAPRRRCLELTALEAVGSVAGVAGCGVARLASAGSSPSAGGPTSRRRRGGRRRAAAPGFPSARASRPTWATSSRTGSAPAGAAAALAEFRPSGLRRPGRGRAGDGRAPPARRGLRRRAQDPAAAARHLLHRCNAAEVVLSLAARSLPAGRGRRAAAALRVVLDASGLSTCEATAAEAPHYASCLTAALAALVHARGRRSRRRASGVGRGRGDLLDRTVRSAAATAEGCKALAPLLPTAAILAGSLAAAYGRAEDDAGDAGWIAAARWPRWRPTAAAARRWRSAAALAAFASSSRRATSGAPRRCRRRSASTRARDRWDWRRSMDAAGGGAGPLARPARIFALASLRLLLADDATRGGAGSWTRRGTRAAGRRARSRATASARSARAARRRPAPRRRRRRGPSTAPREACVALAADGDGAVRARATAKALAADDEANGDVAAAARDAEHDAHAALLLPAPLRRAEPTARGFRQEARRRDVAPALRVPLGGVPHAAVALAAAAAAKPWAAVLYGELALDPGAAAAPGSPRRDRETDDNDGEAGAEGVARDAIDAASALLGDSDALRGGAARVEVEADADAWLSRVVEVKRSTGGWRDVLGEVDAALHARRLAGGFGAEARWRAADWAWDAPDDAHDTFDGAFYGALRRLSARDGAAALERLARAKTLAVDGGAASTLSPKTVAALRGRLLAVAEASEVVGAACGPGDAAGVLDLWQRRGGAADLASGALFGDVGEVALASREATLRAAKTAASSACARGAVGVASSAVARLRVAAGGGAAGARVAVQYGKVLWASGDRDDALRHAKRVVEATDAPPGKRKSTAADGDGARSLADVRFDALVLAGSWAAQTRSETSSAILDRYLRAASDAAAKDRGADCRRSARLALGDYVAVLQAKLEARFKSPEWRQARRVAADRSKQLRDAEALFDAVSQLKGAKGSSRKRKAGDGPGARAEKLAADPDAVEHLRRQCVVLRRECDIDDEALENLTSQRRVLLVEALEAFSAVLTDGGAGAEGCDDLARRAASAALSSRLAAHGDVFGNALDGLLLKLCDAAPARTVLQLVALANGGDVEPGDKGAGTFKENHASSASPGGAAPRRLLDAVKASKTSPAAPLVGGLEELAAAYVDLALAPTEPVLAKVRKGELPKGGKFPFAVFCGKGRGAKPLDQRVKALLKGAAVPVVTRLGMGAASGFDAPLVSGFAPNLALTDTGIHRPKIVECLGADGRRHKQLVKGRDDVRQDAVMEQVFEAAGVLEWVDHTIPFGAYLTDRSGSGAGAHSRYHPSDLSHQECRAKLTNAKDGKGSAKKADEARRRKRRAFDDICAKFRPAFRFFFVEHFADARDWLDRRGAYTRSVAANAMVGHVLGIGDRHAQNILVDTRSGEQVHIDFGVAFDQGKALTAPETVPFRLTRDVVDGMGCHGTHGAFTLAAEATMKTLRRHAGEIVTILDVLIHDPLYRWMVSPKDARHRQRHDDADDGDDASRPGGGESNAGDANDDAKRALFKVKQKPQGYEDAGHDVLSVEGQVKNLVADATDPENLCVLFPGWAPWL